MESQLLFEEVPNTKENAHSTLITGGRPAATPTTSRRLFKDITHRYVPKDVNSKKGKGLTNLLNSNLDKPSMGRAMLRA